MRLLRQLGAQALRKLARGLPGHWLPLEPARAAKEFKNLRMRARRDAVHVLHVGALRLFIRLEGYHA